PFAMFIAERLPLRRAFLLTTATVVLVALLGCGVTVLSSWLADGMSLRPGEVMLVSLNISASQFIFAAFIVGVTAYQRLRREAMERQTRAEQLGSQLADARLRRLRSDLQPHFLFNTLNAVATLVHVDARAAEATIGKLIDLLKRSTDTTERTVVPLREELDFAARYLDLQKVRFGDRLQASIDVADARLLDVGVPPLILQPIIENSVMHGLKQREGCGSIRVNAFAADGLLRIDVRDDGPGYDPAVPQRRNSIGIPNTRERLQTLYARPDALRFRAEAGAFITEIRIPLAPAS
ncbi:MAG TPA: histidine kinase, partial [Thermoanaerobaculia bacterium]|nr:histidine kinase [Thermoanaerobaculia bacterium]